MIQQNKIIPFDLTSFPVDTVDFRQILSPFLDTEISESLWKHHWINLMGISIVAWTIKLKKIYYDDLGIYRNCVSIFKKIEFMIIATSMRLEYRKNNEAA